MFKFNVINELISKKQLTRKGLTVEEQAKEIGISIGSLNNIKSGKVDPQISTVIKIAEYYEVDLNYLCGVDIKINDFKDPPISWEMKSITEKDGIRFLAKELERAHDTIEMFKRGDMLVVNPKKD